MSEQSYILNSYLESLLKDKKSSDKNELLDQVIDFSNALISDQNIWVFLNSPLMSTDEKFSFLKNFAHKLNVNSAVLNMFVLMSKNKRLKLITLLPERAKQIQDEINDISNIEMITSVDVTEDIKNKVLLKLKEIGYNNVSLSYKTDTTLVAGFKLLTGNNLYDLSLKSAFNEFQQQLKKIN